jgi:PadR family transcriptional regulator AphA
MTRLDVNLTPTAYAILGLLRERPMHGYEIAQHFKPEEDLGQVTPADMSTIYTFLKDLQEHGLIRGRRETVGARPPRTVFSPTEEAEPLFLDWVRRPVARIREVRSDFLLKLYFAQRLGPIVVKTLVTDQIATCQNYLERQHASVRSLEPTSFEAIVSESKLTAAESVLAWLDRVATWANSRKRRVGKTGKRSGKRRATRLSESKRGD